MQKVQNNWADICVELNEKLGQFKGRPGELSLVSGVSYHCARRFLLHGVQNQNENARKLCEHFQIQIEETAKVQIASMESLTGLLKEVWDGSEPHAELIAELIKSTRPFKVIERR